MTQSESRTIYIVKAFAVLSIICAHCCGVLEGSSFANVVSSTFLSSLGSIGVGVFLFLSGYLMFFTQKNATAFFLSKIRTLLVPWLLCGTAVYLYITLRKGNLSVFGLVKWLLGVDTYLYYMTVLSVLYVAFFFIRKRKWVLIAALCLSGGWNIVLGILREGTLGETVAIYLDPIRFAFFFVLGLLVANLSLGERLFAVCKRYAVLLGGLLLTLLTILSVCGEKVDYFKVYYIFVELLALATIVGASAVAASNADILSALLTYVGKISFSIYLLHIPIAGIVANLFKRVDFFAVTLMRPFVVLFVVCVAVWAVMKILPKGKLSAILSTLIGAR